MSSLSEIQLKNIITQYLLRKLEVLTDRALKEKRSSFLPIVGVEPSLEDLIINAKKAFFVIEAHTGAGKTTFALYLYHKALHKLIPYDVIYINFRALQRIEQNIPSTLRKVFEILRNPGNFLDKDYVFTTITTENLISGRGDLNFNDLEQLDQNNLQVILILDELEITATNINLFVGKFASLAKTLREYFNKTNTIPLKIVITYPRILNFTEELNRRIHDLGYDVEVLTEFRRLSISGRIIEDYIKKLEKYFSSCGLDKLLFRRVPRGRRTRTQKGFVIEKPSMTDIMKLSLLENGRIAFSILRKMIADSLAYVAIQGANLSISLSEFIQSMPSASYQCSEFDRKLFELVNRSNILFSSSLAEYMGDELYSIIQGRYYAIKISKSESIELWNDAIRTMINRYIGVPSYSLVSKEVGYIIYAIDNNKFIWLALGRELYPSHYDKAARKIVSSILPLRTIGRRREIPSFSGNIRVAVLVPETTRGTISSHTMNIGRGLGAIEFKIASLSKSEILALIGISNYSPALIDRTVSDAIVKNELIPRVKKLLAI